MIRQFLSALSRKSWVRKLAVSTPILRGLAWSFVAGESQEEGLEAVRQLNARGVKGTLNFIGTHVTDRHEADSATGTAVQCLEQIHARGLDAHLSLKLTQIGLDLDLELCRANLRTVLETARARGIFVRIDMEESRYVDATLALFEQAHAAFPGSVGIVLQSYLRRNRADLERMVALGAGIRLVKGGYWESGEVVLRKQGEIDAAFLGDLEFILRHGTGLALASHDPLAIGRTIELAEALGLAKDAFEFQMLFGVRPELMEDLVRRGFRVRSYVPYGTHWYEYVLGCIRRDPGKVFRPSATPGAQS